ncbi:DUF4190 domain-containing protein [Micromonospora craniellae]|uniref:DUF4190 domain-containing protein n=1 Tax=Micromonospora craniellae TaxID=2294034 RepID=A0A372G675_9ACTN|nr:DUF4190 domain-containing protein [Micromonospora craniellae]QOC90399.1 hypothetical protein ID554_19715 [Micromonospora craniellae]RFS48210.1 hypothetical protein D0Q02_01625 [Micromonospora craniellae]
MQPGSPGQDPYGQQPPYGDPTAPPPHNPYAPPPANPYAPPPANPYATPEPHTPVPDPYGQQPASPAPYDPYGQQPPTSGQPYDPYSAPPYGQPPAYGPPPTSGQPYGQPYQDPYAPQPYGAAPMYPHAGFAGSGGQQNTLGLVSMILGIVSIPLVCCYLGIPLGLAAAITGWMGKQKADQGLASNSGQALAGLICGGVGIVLGVLQIVLLMIGFASGA